MTAANAANIGKLSEKGEQPSLFDILAQESLTTSLKPALLHLLKFLAASNPRRFATANAWGEELYTAFDFILQNHYLKHYSASFSENFYAMKRVVERASRSRYMRARSLAVLVLWPYVKGKLEAFHEQVSEALQFVRPRQGEPLRVRLLRVFVKVWPWINAVMSAVTFVMQLSYAISLTRTHSPGLVFAGVRLEKLTEQDIDAFDAIPVHLQKAGIVPRLWRLLLSLPSWASRLFGYGLFFVQFLDFLNNSDIGAHLKSADWSIPTAPHAMMSEAAVHTMDVSKCPICFNRRRNDTALSVSGYVFCFTCIDTFVRKEGKCPVTGLPAGPTQLVRLFVSP